MARTPYSDPDAEAEYQRIAEGSSGVSGMRPETASGNSNLIPDNPKEVQVYSLDQAKKKLGK